jgi:hypothetical protein
VRVVLIFFFFSMIFCRASSSCICSASHRECPHALGRSQAHALSNVPTSQTHFSFNMVHLKVGRPGCLELIAAPTFNTYEFSSQNTPLKEFMRKVGDTVRVLVTFFSYFISLVGALRVAMTTRAQ